MDRVCYRMYFKKRKILWYIAVCVCLGFGILSFGLTAWNTDVSAEDGGHILADGNYAVDVDLTSGGSGKASVETPTLMAVEKGEYFALITWSSSNYDYMIVDGQRYENQSGNGGNSSFLIPILAFDEDMPVIADTVAMGEPHEIQYTLHFYSDSVASESSLPREGAKRVLMMAAVIIIVGGILNHYTNKRRRKDYG